MKAFVIALVFGVFLKSGIIVNEQSNSLQYFLSCPDTDSCYHELDLKIGFYKYIGKDGNQVRLLVTDSAVYQLGAQTITFR